MSTCIIYKTLIDTYKRLGRDAAPLALKIDTAYAMGRLTESEYAELILAVTPAEAAV